MVEPADATDTGLHFELLGPLRASRHGDAIDLGRTQQRVVLALLLLHRQRPFPRAQLTAAIWGESAPTYAINLLQKHVSVLRQILQSDRPARERSLLRWTDVGYVLDVPPGAIDLTVYEMKIRQARAARIDGDLGRASKAFAEAMQLWRGSFCDGLTSPMLDSERERLHEQRIDVIESQVEVDLMLGHDSDQIFDLRRLVAENPLRERLRASLMLALYRAGHTADALAAYRATRRHLHEELGVEPSAEVQRLHERMLAADPALVGGRSHALRAESGTQPPGSAAEEEPAPDGEEALSPVVPAQLTHAISDFTGRVAYLHRLDTELARGEASEQPTPLIIVIGGSAGVGKTALAVEWAHRVKDRFTDGQLYVNLRGYDPIGSPVEPGEAVRGFLGAFGVGKRRMPVTLEAQTALYRSIVAQRRVLVVLDNVRDVDQVRPLLPGGFNSVVIVTSREDLIGLVVADNAIPITLGLMSRQEAHKFLSRRLGSARVSKEPMATERIASACARLPLALAIVAARAALRPDFPLDDLASELRQFGDGLDGFEGGDDSSDVRRVFSWSYLALAPPVAQMFRLLGLHPGPHISLPAASALSATSLANTRKLLGALAKAHLVDEVAPGRFVLHDLLRAYASELVEDQERTEDRARAGHRLLSFLAGTARDADRLLNPTRFPDLWLTRSPEWEADRFAGAADALNWFAVEYPVLLAALHRARETGLDQIAYELAWGLSTFLHRGGHWYAWEIAQRAALEAARSTQDRRGQAYAEHGLGRAHTWLLHFEDAAKHFVAALSLFQELGDRVGQAQSHRHIAWSLERQGQFALALPESEAALALFRVAGPRAGLAEALNAVGWFHAQLGDPSSALPLCFEALALHQQVGDREGEAHTLDSLGFVHHNLGDVESSIAYYHQSIAAWRDISDRYDEAATLVRLGHAFEAGGQMAQARATWLLARSAFRELGHPEAERVSLELERTGGVMDPNTRRSAIDRNGSQSALDASAQSAQTLST